MNTIQQTRRVLPAIVTTTLLVALGTLPAVACQGPGPAVREIKATTATYSCALQRVGTQFVKCDDLTGNGVPAPAWVPER